MDRAIFYELDVKNAMKKNFNDIHKQSVSLSF
ncbi:hypothetical protein SAMN05444281_1172 [Wenyingzhuangia marina]|uniref:Uncharacterized protein n=1 Tax=Wenyingzhuangia marina TaxID=1195760 RepID=A0A1M5UCJ9_9FLAO|nr:hypothetical protein SAMN05444281_1172 [Wenyingzhuangia marina]